MIPLSTSKVILIIFTIEGNNAKQPLRTNTKNGDTTSCILISPVQTDNTNAEVGYPGKDEAD